MKECQIVIFILICAALFRGLWQDMYGIKEHKPFGFSGAVITVVMMAFTFWLYWKAGCFSQLF